MPEPIKLKQVVDAMEPISDMAIAYYHRPTGTIVEVPTAEGMDLSMDVDLDAPLDELPEWQRELVTWIRRVDEHRDEFVGLPDRFEINEWNMMASFAASLEDDKQAADLDDAIRGSGAFGRFKGYVHRHGLGDAWYAFRNAEYERIARGWCEFNEIPFEL